MGSTFDSQVLRDAVTRGNGLTVPHGNYVFLIKLLIFLIYDLFFKIYFGIFILGYYYPIDDSYTNGERFLAPYRETNTCQQPMRSVST